MTSERKNLKLQTKIMLLVAIPVTIFSVFILGMVYQNTYQNLFSEKESATKSYLDIAYSNIVKSYNDFKAGKLKENEAKKIAMDNIREMKYGPFNDYFWINDNTLPFPKMIMHSVNSGLDGKILDNPSYNVAMGRKQNLFQAMVEVCQKEGEGFVDYLWPKPGQQEPLPKISYVKLFKEWNWIVGTGIYTDDVALQARSEAFKILTLAFISLIIILGLIIYSLNKMVTKPFLNVSNILAESATQISDASVELSNASQSLSSMSNEQASSIQETSSSLEEISGMIKNNVSNAEDAFKLSTEVKEKSEVGNKSMQSLTQSMSEILKSNEKIKELVKVIGNIGEKTKVMDEIVFQTKLLSFNASVEAERAGEHGRGFAVVAQEVGNLAQMSGKSAQEIADIVKNSIKEAEAITEENKKKVENGNIFVTETSKVLEEILKSAAKVAEGSKHVLDASKDQDSGIAQINVAMSELDRATQENAATAEETASSSEELNAQVSNLNKIVSDIIFLVQGKDDKVLKNIPKNSFTDAKRTNIVSFPKHEKYEAHEKNQNAVNKKAVNSNSEFSKADDSWEKL